MSDPIRTANAVALSSVVDAETTAAYARKASLETRAGSIVVAAGAVITVFLTLRTTLELQRDLLEPGPASLVFWGLVGAALALVAGVIGALPIFYPAIDADLLRVLLRDDLDGSDFREHLIDLRATTLTSMMASNTFKAWVVLVGYLFVLTSVGVFGLALLTASGIL